MKILALDTTTNLASVCLTNENKLISEVSLNCVQNHSSILLPIIKQVMDSSNFTIKDLDFIACCSGPGSFTGLRVGAATSKALALSLGKPIISVPTLKALAYNIHNTRKTIIPILDAKGENVFSDFYQWVDGELVQTFKPRLQSIEELCFYVKNSCIDPIFVGEAVDVYRDKILDICPDFEFAPQILNLQRAYSLASIAYEYALQKRYVNFRDFDVFYMRKSQAEIQLKEKS